MNFFIWLRTIWNICSNCQSTFGQKVSAIVGCWNLMHLRRVKQRPRRWIASAVSFYSKGSFKNYVVKIRWVKVSKSRKQIMMSLILPKNERNSLRRVCFGRFGRIRYIIIFFRDLLTFKGHLFSKAIYGVLKSSQN